MGMMELRRLIIAAQDLPPQYKKVDSIWSYRYGGQIDTGVAGADDLKIQAVFMIDFFASYIGLFGNYFSETTNCWRLITMGSDNGSMIGTTNHKTSGGGASVAISGGYKNRKIKATLDYETVSFDADGITNTGSTAGKPLGDSNTTNIGIGNAKFAPASAYNESNIVTWYGFRIWKDDTLIRDYVPCIRMSDMKAGFYDKVNHTFNPSVAQSDFFAN